MDRIFIRRLAGFPPRAEEKTGFQLGKVQAGLDPEDWKPFDAVGAGAKEIRIKDSQGIYRVMFVAKFEVRRLGSGLVLQYTARAGVPTWDRQPFKRYRLNSRSRP